MSVFLEPSTGPAQPVDDYDERAARAVQRAKQHIKEILTENPAMRQLYTEAIQELAEEENNTEG